MTITRPLTGPTCLPFDKSCQDGQVVTESFPGPPQPTNSHSANGDTSTTNGSSGDDDDSAGARSATALSWTLGVVGTLVVALNVL